VGFVADKVALEQVFLRVLRFPLPVSFHRGFSILTVWGKTNRLVGGCSSETLSHPIDMNMGSIIDKIVLI
jgi:hypothetical protein